MHQALDSIGVFFDHLAAVDKRAIAGRGLPAPRPRAGRLARLAERHRRGVPGGEGALALRLRLVPGRRRRQRADPGARRRRGPPVPRQEQDPERHLHDARGVARGDGDLRHGRGAEPLRLRAHPERPAEPRRRARPAELRLRLAVPAAEAARGDLDHARDRDRHRRGLGDRPRPRLQGARRPGLHRRPPAEALSAARRALADRRLDVPHRDDVLVPARLPRRRHRAERARRPGRRRASPRCCRSARAASAPSRRCSSSCSPARRRAARCCP